MEIFWRKKKRFSRRIWPDWGNTTWADMAGLRSIMLISEVSVTIQLVRIHKKIFIFKQI